jgi:hypothetical protein
MGEKVGHRETPPAVEAGVAEPADPGAAAVQSLTQETVLSLQRSVGNAAVQRALRAAPPAQRAVLARDPDSDYEDAVKKANWPLAAERLNGFSREDILVRLKKRSVAEIKLLHQGATGNPKVGPNSQLSLLTPDLLSDFSGKFRDSAELIRLSPEAMKLVIEAETSKVKFGGYAEDGPAKDPWPYTAGDTVYVPKAHTDNVVAMSDFLFELNNAIRAPAFAKLHKNAAAGSIDAKKYAHDILAQEVEGMLRFGQVWFETKKAMGGGKELDKYDFDNYQTEYNAFLKGTKTKEDIVTDVLKWVYTEGVDAGKTHEQFYVEEYNKLKPKKAPTK